METPRSHGRVGISGLPRFSESFAMGISAFILSTLLWKSTFEASLTPDALGQFVATVGKGAREAEGGAVPQSGSTSLPFLRGLQSSSAQQKPIHGLDVIGCQVINLVK